MHTEWLTYFDDQTELSGYFTKPDNEKNYPLILIAHAWGGCDEFVCQKARNLSDLGYAAFALDMYGKGIRGSSVEENSRLMTPFMEDRDYLLKRIEAALKFSKELPNINPQKIGAMGFCFGGLCVLDLARSGAELKGVVSFHGLLNRPENEPIKNIPAKILALHGHADPMGPPEQVQRFQTEMEQAEADWQMHIYGHTMHAFTNPQANDQSLGLIYNASADQRAWQAMTSFFEEIFK